MSKYKNILIVRTDRMGDVVLTTPVIDALRKYYPSARLSMMVSPMTKDLILGHKHLDEVLLDDRLGRHRGPFGFLRLILTLRKKRFDCVLVFHTKRRTNLACFLAGIPVRIGYKNNKFGVFLNRPLEDVRHRGLKHEAEYCLDVLKVLGIKDADLKLSLCLQDEDRRWGRAFRLTQCSSEKNRFIAIHAGASDPSKCWPEGRFAELIKRLVNQYRVQIVLVGSGSVIPISQNIVRLSDVPVVDMTGKTTVGQLAGLLSECSMLISNDSGPVHVAAGLNIPVISIFTRNQPGINPERWRPLNVLSRVISVSPAQSLHFSFQRAGTADTKYLELIPTEVVLEAVDSLFKLC